MNGQGVLWALLASLGPRELIVVAVVALVLYGRSGARKAQFVRALWPSSAASRRPAAPAKPGRLTWEERFFWFLAIAAAAALAAWIVTRTLILGAPGVPH